MRSQAEPGAELDDTEQRHPVPVNYPANRIGSDRPVPDRLRDEDACYRRKLAERMAATRNAVAEVAPGRGSGRAGATPPTGGSAFTTGRRTVAACGRIVGLGRRARPRPLPSTALERPSGGAPESRRNAPCDKEKRRRRSAAQR